MKVKAQEFAGRMSINDFQASPGWVTNFKKCQNLSQFARQGEGNSAPLEDPVMNYNNLFNHIQLKTVLIVMKLRFFIVWILLKR